MLHSILPSDLDRLPSRGAIGLLAMLLAATVTGGGFAHAAAIVPDDAEASADQPQSESAAASLSVAPQSLPAYPDDRPGWIDQPPVLEGPVHLWPVAAVPALTAAQSRHGLETQKRVAVAAYIQHLTGATEPLPLGLDARWIDEHLISPQHVYSGTVITSDGVMYEHAVQLQFDDAFRQMVWHRYDEYRVGRRLGGLGMVGAGGLGLLLALTGLLRVAHRRTA